MSPAQDNVPVIKFMIVVLPAPEAPMMAVVFPGSSAPDGPRMMTSPVGSLSRRSLNSMR